MAYYRVLMDVIGTAVDAVGVLVIVVGALLSTHRFLFRRQELVQALPARPGTGHSTGS